MFDSESSKFDYESGVFNYEPSFTVPRKFLEPEIVQDEKTAAQLVYDTAILPYIIAAGIEEFADVPADIIQNTFLPKARFYMKDENGKRLDLSYLDITKTVTRNL